MRTMIAAMTLMALGLTACATFTPAQRNAEIAWQALDLADLGQTVTITRRPTILEEDGMPTRFLLGAHPSERGVEKYFAVGALAHYVISGWLARQANATGAPSWRWALRGWYAITLGYSAYCVGRNASRGIPLFGSRRTAEVTQPVGIKPSCSQLECRPVQ